MNFAIRTGMGFCSHCGAPVGADAQFCSRCGKPVGVIPPGVTRGTDGSEKPRAAAPVPPPPPRTTLHPPAAAPRSTPPPARDPRGRWWITPVIVIGLVLIAWLVIAGMPFGGDEDGRKIATNDTAASDTIAEGTAAPSSTMEVGGTAPANSTDFGFEVTEAPPPLILPENPTTPPQTASVPPTATVPPPMTSATPDPAPAAVPLARTRPAPAPAPAPTPAPVRRTPPPKAPERTPAPAPSAPAPDSRSMLSESEAAATLRRYIAATDYYDGVRGDCLQVRSSGYRNVGYGFDVWDACVGGGISRRLGVWRVDAKNGDVFLRGPSGRYGKP